MTSSYPRIGDPNFDPYDLLGLGDSTTTPSDAEISKAYRKLALQLHPDKQKGDISEKEAQRISFRFHAIQEARAFLLEPEHARSRQKYDAKRASQQQRRRQDKEREQHMSERRKRMRDDLKRKEEELSQKKSSGRKQRRGEEEDEALLQKLRKEGKQRKEQFADRTAQEEADIEAEAVARRKSQKIEQEKRQVRLKWSRSRISVSPSEDSLAQILSQFGTVEHVEMLGSKGNAALVTFSDASSCRPCVDFYANSNEMRATFVGSRKVREEEEEAARAREASVRAGHMRQPQDTENLEERKIRQAAEREELLRQMELEESGAAIPNVAKPPRNRQETRPFPLDFPNTEEYHGLTPLQKLEHFEKLVFGD
jgi:DnaJ family protein C protein 17